MTNPLDRFASIVRRGEEPGPKRNWTASQRAAFQAHAAAITYLVQTEDAEGVQAAARSSARLTTLRQRAQLCGLLSPEAVLRSEAEGIARADQA